MSASRLLTPVFLALLAGSVARPAVAAWPHDPNFGNVPVSTVTGSQDTPAMVSDSAGGTIVAWEDLRSGTYDVYAQRISAAGVPLWTTDGLAVSTAPNVQVQPRVVSDGAGGVIVVWADLRSAVSYDIYAQRISAAGVPQWTPDGVALCVATGNQLSPVITSDGSGGALVAWYDIRSGVNNDIYAQRVSAAGVPLWTANGVAVCNATGSQSGQDIVSDGAGGALIAWQDLRSTVAFDVYAQRLNAFGVPLWAANGVPVCTAAGDQTNLALVSDGAGGTVMSWVDGRVGGGATDIYAQRVSSAGVAQWAANGAPVCAASGNQQSPALAPDGTGGAIVAWSDPRGVISYDVYAQRMSATGAALWTVDGVSICTAANNQSTPTLAADGSGGAVIVWSDARTATNTDIYAQRVNSAGTMQWTGNGVAICSALGDQIGPQLVGDGGGGAIAAWTDSRSSISNDVYAQRVESFGKLGSPEPANLSVLDVPNDQGGRVRLAWDASYLDGQNDPDLTAYDVFRSIPPNVVQDAVARGEGSIVRPGEAPAAGRRTFLVAALGTAQFAWEYVTSVSAQHFLATYGSLQATTGDSVAGSNPTTAFMVVGRNGSGSKYWLSSPASGYSVDNLPPAAPAPFTGQYGAGIAHLHWNRNIEADLAGYRLYRGTSAGFVPGPGTLVATLPDSGYADAAGSPYVYKLTAIDSHGNESPVATLVPTGTTGVPDAVLALGFAAPSPNPARGETSLEYTLSREGAVRLAIYDAAGRRVASLRDGVQSAGVHRESFTLRDAAGRELPSGVYLARLEAEGRVLTRRIAAVR